MKPETADRVLQTMNEQVQQLGFKDCEAARDFAVATLSNLVEQLRQINLRKDVANDPEPSPAELQQQLTSLKQIVGLLRGDVGKFVKKKIPHRPGGRESVLGSPQKQANRIQQVLSLIGKKVKTTDALKRIAQREGISLSSMQRIWRMRGKSD